jgi:hypothetical protein
MSAPIMPEEFAEIARLSLECCSRDKGWRNMQQIFDDLQSHLVKLQPLKSAISKLSDERLKGLIGWTLFGRDCEGDANPVEELAACIAQASVRDREAAIAYVMGMPIHKFLERAQENLRISKEFSAPAKPSR